MNNGSGVSRGDRNRNARLARLRELVPLENAIVGIDLADKKQMVVVHRPRLEGAGSPHLPVQGLGPGLGVGLGCASGPAVEGLRRGDRLV